MAFGYEYLMVFLPEVCPSSFLLFVHNPAGSTKLRDYSSGNERQLGIRLTAAGVISQTEVGRTRFYYEPHPTVGEGVGYWSQVTAELNRRCLSNRPADHVLSVPVPVHVQPSTPHRAHRGSQRQLQDYVNQKPEVLDAAILAVLPPRLTELGASIRWVSPLARADYQEYRDGDFLAATGMPDAASQLAEFWPSMGPCWDALGVISDPGGRLKPGAILVEAKSHISEIYGNGCQAAGESLYKIDRALAEAKEWLSVEGDADWLGPLYQYANRIAHLYFLLKKVGRPAWLVNLYFLDDPIGPTTQEEWQLEIQNVKDSISLPQRISNAVDVFLPALTEIAAATPTETIDTPPEDAGHDPVVNLQASAPQLRAAPVFPAASDFRSWSLEWIELASYPGPCLRDPEARIQRLLSLWKEPVPGSWQRSVADIPSRLLNGKRYTRGDEADPRSGEHRIEHETLYQHFDAVRCLEDGSLVDGVNAFPLVRDGGGGRNGNVEADMLLLVRNGSGYRLVVAEVKHSANNAWFAAVENLRQLKLLICGAEPGRFFLQRNPSLDLPADLPITGLVVAPCSFYSQPGQKANSIGAARMLIHTIRAEADVEVRLSVWDTQHRTIALFG
jgi:hypothetical protein